MAEEKIKPFKLEDSEAIEALANKLDKMQMGWLDKDIDTNIREVSVIKNDSMGRREEYFRFKIFWFHVLTNDNLTMAVDPFIYGQKAAHLNNLQQIRENIKKNRLGELLYYSFEKSGKEGKEVAIEGFLKVYQPIETNKDDIGKQIQKYIDSMPNSCRNKWKVAITSFTIPEYLKDVIATLKNKYIELLG